MLRSIVAVGVCIFAVMVVIKDGRALRMTGLAGSCSIVQTFSDSSELALCRSGKLEGRPDLSHRGYRSIRVNPASEYWLCPAGFAESR